MFRRGGDAGITTGLERKNFDQGGWEERVLPTSGEMERFSKLLGPRGRDRSLSDFLINFGLNMVGNAPTGNILQTAATEAKEPFNQFQQQKAYREASEREETAGLLKAVMDAKATALSEGQGGDLYSSQVKAAESKRLLGELFTLKANQNDPAKKLGDEAYNKAQSLLMLELKSFTGFNPAVDSLFKSSAQADLVIGSIQQGLTESAESITIINENGEEEEVIEGEYYLKNPEALGKRTQELWMERYKEAQRESLGLAHGGRARHALGDLATGEQVTEQVSSPAGTIRETETVEGASPELSYEELRRRLPPEVTDNVIRLITESPAALIDFAEIQTQIDVDNFNAKYGVNLVLPSEA